MGEGGALPATLSPSGTAGSDASAQAGVRVTEVLARAWGQAGWGSNSSGLLFYSQAV